MDAEQAPRVADVELVPAAVVAGRVADGVAELDAFQDEAIDFVRRTWGDVEVLISLDNEPDLWSSTHARIHPDPVTYAEPVAATAQNAFAVSLPAYSVTVLVPE